LGLKNARVFAGRAEVFGETADLVTMRAVEKFEGALPMATKLVKPGGRLALMIGAGQVASARETDGGISWHEPVAVPGGHSRVLLVGDFRIG
jgi:16S rRNA G527 N7-methylase RsmG